MNKILMAISIFLLLLIVIIFTPFGSNTVIKPILNSCIKDNVKVVDVKIEEFKNGIKESTLKISLNEALKVYLKGKINFIRRECKLKYIGKIDKVRLKDKEYKSHLKLKGLFIKTKQYIKLYGKGRGFGGKDIFFKTLITKELEHLILKSDYIELAEVLPIFKIPPILSGLINLDINIPKNSTYKYSTIIFSINLNRNLIEKKYGLKFKSDEVIDGYIRGYANRYIYLDGNITNRLVNLRVNKLIIKRDLKKFKGDIDINIPSLKSLSSIFNKSLKGKLDSKLYLYLDLNKKITSLQLSTRNFGGVAKIFYQNSNVNISLKDISLQKILSTLSIPKYTIKGDLNSSINLDTENLNTSFNLESKGSFGKKLFKVRLPNYSYHISGNGKIKEGILYIYNLNLGLNFLNLRLSNFIYSNHKSYLTGDFKLDISNLNKIKNIINTILYSNRNIKGNLNFKGNFIYSKGKFRVKAISTSLDGKSIIKIFNHKIFINFQSVSFSKLLNIFGYKNFNINRGIFNGDLSLNLKDLDSINGSLNFKATGLLSRKLLKNLGVFKNITYRALLKNGKVYNSEILSPSVKINLPINLSAFKINLSYFNYSRDKISGIYKLDMDLKRAKNYLSILRGKNVNGRITIDGKIDIFRPKGFFLSGFMNIKSALVKFTLIDRDITLDGAAINSYDILNIFKYEKGLSGILKIHLTYNRDKKVGAFKIEINDARVIYKRLIKKLKKLADTDLSKIVFPSFKVIGDIKKDFVKFNFLAKKDKIKLSVKNGKINIRREEIDTTLNIDIDGKKYSFLIKGSLKRPSIKVSKRERESYIDLKDEKILKDLKIDNNKFNKEIEDIFNTIDSNQSGKKDSKNRVKETDNSKSKINKSIEELFGDI